MSGSTIVRAKTISILQPGYLPWLGFFEQMHRADVFVLYDDVQFDKNGWRNRNRIKTPQGPLWLTVPVLTKGKNKPLVKDVLINNMEKWSEKQIRTIKQYYRKAPFFDLYFPRLNDMFSKNWMRLLELDYEFILMCNELLGIERKVVLSSSLPVSPTGKVGPAERLIEICRHFVADVFYEGAAGKNYIDEKLFNDAGISLVYQDYKHPEYRQMHGQFISHLSVIDLLMNEGPDSLGMLLKGA